MLNIIKDLITKFYSEKYIIFFSNDYVYINNKTFEIKEENWKQIKRRINLLISNDNECKICYEEFDKEYHTITCKWCDNSLCLYCYINILKTNNGKHDCPYCKRRISTFHCHTNEEFKDYIGHLVYKNTISDNEKILLDKAKIRDVKKEEKKSANIKCPRCKTYKYEEDFINNKNRILKTCIDCRKRNKKYRDNEKLV